MIAHVLALVGEQMRVAVHMSNLKGNESSDEILWRSESLLSSHQMEDEVKKIWPKQVMNHTGIGNHSDATGAHSCF